MDEAQHDDKERATMPTTTQATPGVRHLSSRTAIIDFFEMAAAGQLA